MSGHGETLVRSSELTTALARVAELEGAAATTLAADRKRAAAHLQRVLDLYPSRRMSNALRCDLEVVLSYIEIGEPAP